MASLLPNFEYDIFISYRHNDNRSGWVTEFVKALQDELAATIKEPLSIYFDSNPYDGLLETHDVDGSLKEKVKCLVFIPIVSQTYCDPNSFAWQKEFLAFIEFTKSDNCGLDIKLHGGNMAKRILPVRIHEVDGADKQLFETKINGVMRSVDFIYKTPGVNRPLSSTDSRELNLHKTLYRDQVNKVANATKDLLYSLTNKENHDASQFSVSFENPITVAHETENEGLKNPATNTNRHSSIKAIIFAIILSSLTTALVFWNYFREPLPEERNSPIRSSILPPPGTTIELIGEATVGTGRRAIDISKSGDRIVFIGNHKGRPHIFVRELNNFHAQVIPQTEGAYACTLSPDASEVAFFVGNSLRKVKIDGGSAVLLAEAANPMDIIWDSDNTLYFSADEGSSLYRFSNSPELLFDAGTIPSSVAFNTICKLPNPDYLLISSEERIGLYDIRSDSVIDLNLPGSNARFIPGGFIVFMRSSTLMGGKFDLKQAKVTSEPREILSGIRAEGYANGQFAFSDDGTLIYITGKDTKIGAFVWANRNGEISNTPFPEANYGAFKLSPDQTKIAVPIYSTSQDIWVLDLKASKKIRITNGKANYFSLWRDNNSLFIQSNGDIFFIHGERNPPELVLENAHPASISADGKKLVVFRNTDLYILDTQTKELTQITNTPNQAEFHGSISPDGQLLAYTLNDSKSFHVFLQHTTPGSHKVQVSTLEGSEEPRWTADGKKIIFRSGQQWMEAEILNPETLQTGMPEVILEGDYINLGGFSFDISPDGEKLMLVKGTDEKTSVEIRMINNWFTEIYEMMKFK